jgi:hypothetical protein
MRKLENARTGAGGMVVGSDTPLSNSSKELAALADRYRLPAIFQDETVDGVHGASPSKASKVELTFGRGAGAIRICLRRSRTTHSITTDQALWSAIRNRTHAIGF